MPPGAGRRVGKPVLQHHKEGKQKHPLLLISHSAYTTCVRLGPCLLPFTVATALVPPAGARPPTWPLLLATCSGVCYALELHETGSSWTLEPEIEEKEVEERSSFLEQG